MCDPVEIPVKDFLPVGKKENRVIDLKRRKKAAGKLYLGFESQDGAAGGGAADDVLLDWSS